MTVGELIKAKSSHVSTVRPEAKLQDAAIKLTEEHVGLVVVIGKPLGPLLGVISERDIVRAVAAHGPRAFDLCVRDVMTDQVYTCAPEQSLDQLLMTMTARRVRHLPVVKDDHLLGMVSMGDLVVRLMHDVVYSRGSKAAG